MPGQGRGLADHRADRDDAAAVSHKWRCGAYSGGDAADIDGEQPLELGEIVGAVMHRAGGEHAGIVDEDVETAKSLDHGFDEAFHFLGIGLVGPEGLGADALLAQFLHDRLGLVG